MLRVVLLTNIPSPYSLDLFYYLQTKLRYDVHVIYTNSKEENRQWSIDEKKFINSTILKSRIIRRRTKTDVQYVHIPRGVVKSLRLINPDVVIAWEYNPAALQALMWAKIRKKKFIHMTEGTLYSERYIGMIQRIARSVIIRSADAGIVSSTKSKEKLISWGMPDEKIFLSLLTMDLSIYRTLSNHSQSNRILYVGSMTKRKGLDLLIRALSFVKEKYELRIVGNGSKEEILQLKDLAKENGVNDNIVWCGYKSGSELLEEYCTAAVFVLPTREDCYGMVLLEAYCARLPIVSSKYADGAYDIVDDGYNGIIVDPYEPEHLAKALSDVITNRSFMVNAAKNDLDKFELSNTVEGFKDAIQYVTN